jgi:hypothetical protein
MGKISVKVAGQEQFDWTGDESGIADLELAFQATAPHDGAVCTAWRLRPSTSL